MKPVLLTTLTRPDSGEAEPLPLQIRRDLLAAIREGKLIHGAKLPSSRAAAEVLQVSRTTINTAYDLLRAEGVLTVRPGAAPAVVAPANPRRPKMTTRLPLSDRGGRLSTDLRRSGDSRKKGVMSPGIPDEALFPRSEWATALRRVSRRLQGGMSGYDMHYGLPELRQILAERLTADRGLRADPERILVTCGTQASLAMLAQVMADPGDIAAMEDPGYLGARAAFSGAGLAIAPVPVDDEGICAELIPDAARIVYVTPSNQYPLGIRMSLQRRMTLLERARRHNTLIIEDDYDSEFHWRGREIAALAGYGSGEVAYLGSAAKVLMPALRIAWLLLPDWLVEPARMAQRNLGILANIHAQAALADLMRTGRYRAHLRRISRAYEERGHALAEALCSIPGLTIRPPDGGVQLALQFHEKRDEAAILAALAAGGFHPAPLSPCSSTGQTGFIVGFANATPDRIARFREILNRETGAARRACGS
ncbi:PLP-dependent aminotransferase family protein [Paracoccus onubensis]|nr:PLP-dependent aminotransferase family protein [Paracoccus onubensis]